MVMNKKSAGVRHLLSEQERVDRTTLFNKYSRHATIAVEKFRRVGPWPLHGMDENDLRQVGLEKLWFVLSKKQLPILRDSTKEEAYFRNVVFNAIKTQRNRALRDTFKLMTKTKQGEEERPPLFDSIPAPARTRVSTVSSKRVMEYLKRDLTPKQAVVLELYLEGVPHAEIAKQVGWGKSSVSYFVTQTLGEKLRRSGQAAKLRDLLQAA